MRETTEIRIDEQGNETHESWVLIRANRVSCSPGEWLFDSEIRHQHLIMIEVTRCTRHRELNHDWKRNAEILLRMEMSEAQWGAFVSSFGTTGVPATLQYFQGEVSRPPVESRLDQSISEVRKASTEALADIQDSYNAVMEIFEAGGGKKAQREALRNLGIRLQNGPANMEFAAKSLTEHVENVVTKARSDIEAMTLQSMEQGALPSAPILALGSGA